MKKKLTKAAAGGERDGAGAANQEQRAREYIRTSLGNRRVGIPATSWVEGEEPSGMWDYMRLPGADRDRLFRAVWDDAPDAAKTAS